MLGVPETRAAPAGAPTPVIRGLDRTLEVRPMGECSDPSDAFDRLRQVELQLWRLRQVVAAVTGGLSHFIECRPDRPHLDLAAAVEVLRMSYRGELTSAATEDLCRRSLYRKAEPDARCPRCQLPADDIMADCCDREFHAAGAHA